TTFQSPVSVGKGANRHDRTQPPWPRSTLISCESPFRGQTRIVLSSLPDTTYWPSGEKATEWTASVCPSRETAWTDDRFPTGESAPASSLSFRSPSKTRCGSHSRTFLSTPLLATSLPSGEKATA